jgi:pimeloyl-ACP methyl ester carboxylesterase
MKIFFRQQSFVIILSLIVTLGSASAHLLRAQSATPTPPPATTVDTAKGKNPIIIIPGLAGSELINGENEKIVWFSAQRAKDDDLRLPVSPSLARNRDSLRARDILRKVEFLKFLPDIEIYEKLIEALEKRGGYTEGKWDAPPKTGYQDTFYVFPYDWRRDNVENARLLVQKVEALKRKLGRPDLKFNIISHSMGGLIARYAAMYGNADLPAGTPKPTWTGARSFNKIFLLGTPNQGSVEALDSLLNGFSILGGFNLPFIQSLSKFDIFTIPSIYQLLPHKGTTALYDENLKPLDIDFFDIKNWEKYNWSPIQDEDFTKKFTPTEVKYARAYLIAVLTRARRFHEALAANTMEKTPVFLYLIGAECKDTLGAAVIYRDEKKNRWRTIFKDNSFERSNGEKVSDEDLKKVMYELGDGIVTRRSLAAKDLSARGNKKVLPITSEISICEAHRKLVSSPDVQDKLFSLLQESVAAATKAQK